MLSPATSFTDLVEKVKLYKQIPTLKACLIINPNMGWVRLHERGEYENWLPEADFTSLEETIAIMPLPLTPSLSHLYRFVIQ